MTMKLFLALVLVGVAVAFPVEDEYANRERLVLLTIVINIDTNI